MLIERKSVCHRKRAHNRKAHRIRIAEALIVELLEQLLGLSFECLLNRHAMNAWTGLEEVQKAQVYLEGSKNRTEKVQDLEWALLNSYAFLFNR